MTQRTPTHERPKSGKQGSAERLSSLTAVCYRVEKWGAELFVRREVWTKPVDGWTKPGGAWSLSLELEW